MTDELKPCPFCGKPQHGNFDGGCSDDECPSNHKDPQGYCFMTKEEWNTRPIEDALRSENERLAELKNGFPMVAAPRDGTTILVAVYYGASEPLFDVMRCTTSEHIWYGGRGHYDESAGNVKLLRWWPLPGGYK